MNRNLETTKISVRFGVRLILAGSIRQNFAELFVIQFHAHLQYTGITIKRTDNAILSTNRFLSHSKILQYISRQLRFTL